MVPEGSKKQMFAGFPSQMAWSLSWFNLVPDGSRRFQKTAFAGFPSQTAWFQSWFSLVPDGSRRFQKNSVCRISIANGLVPELVQLGSRWFQKTALFLLMEGQVFWTKRLGSLGTLLKFFSKAKLKTDLCKSDDSVFHTVTL